MCLKEGKVVAVVLVLRVLHWLHMMVALCHPSPRVASAGRDLDTDIDPHFTFALWSARAMGHLARSVMYMAHEWACISADTCLIQNAGRHVQLCSGLRAQSAAGLCKHAAVQQGVRTHNRQPGGRLGSSRLGWGHPQGAAGRAAWQELHGHKTNR